MAFSFGPFVGFWSAHDAAIARGCLVIPGGGHDTTASGWKCCGPARRRSCSARPATRCTWPKSAQQRQFDVGSLNVRVLILAGEPGGSIPAVRAGSKRPGRPGPSITPAPPKSARGALPMRRDRACTSTRANSWPSSFRSRPAGRPREGELSRTGPHHAGPRRLPGDALPHGRPGPADLAARSAHPLRAARWGRAGPRGRHDDHPRRERVSQRRRANPAQLSRGARISA